MRTLMKKAALALAVPGLLAATVPAIAAPASHAAASAVTGVQTAWNRDRDYDRGHDRGHDRGRHRGWSKHDRYEGRNNDYRGGEYSQRGYYDEPVYANTRVWRGDDGRDYCRRGDGTTGLVIGGAAGALLGREVAGRNGDRTLGAILGAAGGALLGRSVDRNNSRCR